MSPDTSRQRRILLKLETLWAANLDLPLCKVMDNTFSLPYHLCFNTGDQMLEEGLDRVLAAKGLTVSGGWKS